MVDDFSRHIYKKIKDLRIVKNQNGDIIEAPDLVGENSYSGIIKNSYDANNNLINSAVYSFSGKLLFQRNYEYDLYQ